MPRYIELGHSVQQGVGGYSARAPQGARFGQWSAVRRILEAPLLFNGLPPTSCVCLDASRAGYSGWGVDGSSTVLARAAGTPLFSETPMRGCVDRRVRGDGTAAFYQAVGTTTGDFTTEDLWFDGIIIPTVTGTRAIFSKRQVDNFLGFLVYSDGAPIKIAITTAGPTSAEIVTGNMTSGAPVYFSGAFNRDENTTNGAQGYVNNAASGSGVNPSSAAGSISGTGKFEVFSQRNGLLLSGCTIAFVRVAGRANWFSAGAAGPTSWLAMHQYLYQRGFGRRPLALS